jgi:hypothetical protein
MYFFYLFLFIDIGRRIKISLHKICPNKSHFLKIYHDYKYIYFKFDALEGILGEITREKEGGQKNRHLEESYRPQEKGGVGMFYSSEPVMQDQETAKLQLVNSVLKI